MKTNVFCSIFAIVSLFSVTTFGQPACPSGGGSPNSGQSPYINDPAGPYGVPANDYLTPGGTAVTSSNPNLTVPASTVARLAPTARITVLPADASPSARITSKTPTATLTIVADDPVVSTTPTVTPAPEPKLDERIAKLVGIWKAVARRGNGELTTVELRLDKRGWAEFTVPGSDGKPDTTKSRVHLEDDELKLSGSDKVVSLGKLLEFNSRQMVLERSEGRMTFVRL
jgi:hypothetical protein